MRTSGATPRELELVRELRDGCRRLPARPVSDDSQAANTWASLVNHFRHLVATEDPRQFLAWDHLHTMFVGNADFVGPELEHLKSRGDWEGRWREAVRESEVGHPLRFPSYPQSSGNLLHHAYHLSQFEEATGARVDDFDMVFEFGGGYGSMCRLFHKLGFKGRYVIFDFAEFSLLQQFFLKSVGVPVRDVNALVAGEHGAATVSDPARLKELLPALTGKSRASLFVATWSLSETPAELRREVIPLTSGFNAFLLAYQERFGEMDNDQFFEEWKKSRPDVEWRGGPIEHLPGSSYLFGRARA
jgi:hypothetical protein